MKALLLFGSTGHLGKMVAEEAVRRGYPVTAVVRNEAKAAQMKALVPNTVIADVLKPSKLKGICDGFEIVVSTLGKSVSPADRSRPSFVDVDLEANSGILNEAVKSGVQKFVYVSALGAENNLHLDYFRVHHEFGERLKQSGIDYAIVKPPALFSAFLDLIEMARKGRLITLGKGDKLTNPIWEGDLAKVCVDAIDQPNTVIEAGGEEVLSRKQINETIQRTVAPGGKVRTVPMGVVKAALPLMNVFSKNTFDKFAFFTEVMRHDLLAPRVGKMRLEEYIKAKL